MGPGAKLSPQWEWKKFHNRFNRVTRTKYTSSFMFSGLSFIVSVKVTKQVPQKCQICRYQMGSLSSSKCTITRFFRPGLHLRPRWSSLRPPSRLGRKTPSPHTLPLDAFVVSLSRCLGCQSALQHKLLATPISGDSALRRPSGDGKD